MTRGALAEAGRRLRGHRGSRGDALRRRSGGWARPALALGDLDALPDWLPVDSTALNKLAAEAALATQLRALSRSIDGDLLGAAAGAVGSEKLARALRHADEREAARLARLADPRPLVEQGRALMAAALPPTLAAWLLPGSVPDRSAPFEAAAAAGRRWLEPVA